MDNILQEIREERTHQNNKWGPDHDDKHAPCNWSAFITSYLAEAIDPFIKTNGKFEYRCLIFRYNMIKIAALAIAAVESTDRMLAKHKEEQCKSPK